METKLFEVRDAGTRIVCIGTLMRSDEYPDKNMLVASGFDPATNLVLFTSLMGKRTATYDPYSWGDRTFKTAHMYVAHNWDTLASGDLVDVQYILGERDTPKESEIL